MSLGFFGKKCGMTLVFDKTGELISVTVISFQPNIIIQIKRLAIDGYNSIKIGVACLKTFTNFKFSYGYFKKYPVLFFYKIGELKFSNDFACNYKIGDNIFQNISVLTAQVTIIATTKGKGFQGAIKRHNFNSQDSSHGNSLSHRALGSTGQNQFPGRVFKNKKMAGHMGFKQKTLKHMIIISKNFNKGFLVVKGSIGGSVNSLLKIIIEK